MPSLSVVCPSGLAGSVRALEGKEIAILSDQRLIRSGLLVDRVFDLCWEETSDPGPYSLLESGKPDWQKVIQGDRFFLMTRVHAATFGQVFSFEFQCSDPECKKKAIWDLDLLNELVVRNMSEADRATLKTQNKFPGVLPDGTRFSYRLRTGEDEVATLKIGKANILANLIPIVCSRILEIDGVKPNFHKKYFEDASAGLVFDAISEMEAHDGGVETSFTINCPKCSLEMAVEIPFGQLLGPNKRAPKTLPLD